MHSERIVRWTEPSLPAGVPALAKIARDEGYDFVARWEAEWSSGAARFDGPGECLFLAIIENQLAGISGICCDPYQGEADVGRLRHVYVDPQFRSRGLASRLVRACVDCTGSHFRVIRLNTQNPAAARVYERLGFQPITIEGERMTHWVFYRSTVTAKLAGGRPR
jgi:GNAT superfamily N-acetyltransferase